MNIESDVEKLEKRKLYKVVQITVDGESKLLFVENAGGILHSAILEKYLRMFEISYREIKVGYGFGPDTSGPRYMVTGMGGALLLSKKRIKLFGDSFGYGFKISDAHLDWFREKYSDWEFIAESSL